MVEKWLFVIVQIALFWKGVDGRINYASFLIIFLHVLLYKLIFLNVLTYQNTSRVFLNSSMVKVIIK
jgi:hypothetical protein